MGYFPNGTAGMSYYGRWCANCKHEQAYLDTEEGEGCAVWGAHLLFNYNATEKAQEILDFLISRTETEDELGNEKCKMYLPANDKVELEREGQQRLEL